MISNRTKRLSPPPWTDISLHHTLKPHWIREESWVWTIPSSASSHQKIIILVCMSWTPRISTRLNSIQFNTKEFGTIKQEERWCTLFPFPPIILTTLGLNLSTSASLGRLVAIVIFPLSCWTVLGRSSSSDALHADAGVDIGKLKNVLEAIIRREHKKS